MKNKKKKIVILGGGLTGLAAAEKLGEKYDVTILEKQDYLGGLAASFEHNGKWIPKHYHHIFDHDYITHSYLKRYGLFKDMTWKKIKMAICVNRKIHNFIRIDVLFFCTIHREQNTKKKRNCQHKSVAVNFQRSDFK